MLGKVQRFEPQVRSFDLDSKSIDVDARTVEFDFSSETDEVTRDFGVEILSHKSGDVDLSRLRNKAPYLMDHDSRDQRGVVEIAAINKSRGRAKVRISKSQRGEELWNDIIDGIRTKVSVGYQIIGAKHEGKRSDGLDVFRVRWKPFELSSVSIAADDSVGIRSAESVFGLRAAELSTTIQIMENQDNTEERADSATAPAATVPAETKVESRSADVDSQLSEIRINELAADKAARAIADERDRVSSITELARAFGRDDKEINEAVRKGLSLADYKDKLLEAKRAENPAYSAGRVEVTSEPLKKGTRGYLSTTWAANAKRALGSRGSSIVIPSYQDMHKIERNYIGGETLPFHRSLTGSLTLVDKIAIDEGIGAPIVEEVVSMYPEIAIFPVDTIAGDSITLSIQTGNPSVAFRNANEGTSAKKGTFKALPFQTSIIEQFINVDIQGVLNASKDPARVLTAEARSVTKAVLSHIAFQSWYAGTTQSGADAKASPGILAQSNTASTHVVDATGTTGKTSIWIMELAQGELDHVYGNDNTLMFGEDWTEETVQDADGKSLRCLQNWISGRVAPRLANKNRAIRIKNVSAESTKTATDSLIASALQLAEELGMQPNAIFGTPRSRAQIRTARSVYHPTGQPAPQVNDVFGIPFYSTINISNSETV